MVNEHRTALENTLRDDSAFINPATDAVVMKARSQTDASLSTFRLKPPQSTTRHPSSAHTDRKQTNFVQLYKPVYTACEPFEIEGKFSCDEGDEFELINTETDESYHVLHLRTNTHCTVPSAYLSLDSETPLRLGSNDRGVIQRCLLQHNTPGAYLVRRSRNELDAFVLSISQAYHRRSGEDWHYLICIHPSNRCFYFAQESKLDQMFFTSFQKLVHDKQVRAAIELSTVVPRRIEFEEDLWHIPRRHLTLDRHIGNGEFGEVWRGAWTNGNRTIPVAVKRLHRTRADKATLNDYIREIEVMKTLRNNYIVTLHGVAQDLLTSETLLVTELMDGGDLKNWLQRRADVPAEKLTVSFAYDICRGMHFLEQQLLLHRDLACRNVLLDNGARRAKIADFGLSTRVSKDQSSQCSEIYYQRLPIRWTAPEVLRDQKTYSIKSDVWSFGIVLVEIGLKGADPYPEEKHFSSVRSLVKRGHVHHKPAKCSKQIYNRLILPCLSFQPAQRPAFRSLVDLLAEWNKEKEEYGQLDSSYVQYLS